MPALVQIQCPHCQALMKLKSRDPLGKKVPCPKCKTPFVAKEKVAADEPIEDYDNYDDFGPGDTVEAAEEFEDDFAPPPKRKTGGKKKSKKKKSGGKGLKIGLIIGGSVLGVVIVGLTIWLVFGLFSKKLDLAYLPEDATSITVTRYGEIWNSKLMQDELTAETRESCNKMKEDWGIHPNEVVSVTHASASGQVIKVVRTSVDMDPEKIAAKLGDYTTESYEDKDYYKIGRFAIYFPDNQTAVCGAEDSVKKAIERGPDAKPREELKFVDAGYQKVSIRIKSGSSSRRVSSRFAGIPMGKIVATSSGSSIDSSVKSIQQYKFESVEAAKEYYDTVQELQEKMRKEIENLKNSEEFRRFSSEKQREAERAISSHSSSFKRSGDVVIMKSSFTPTKEFRTLFGRGLSVSWRHTFSSIAHNPERLFGYFRSPVFGGNRNRGAVNRNVPRRNVTRVYKYEARLRNFRGNGDEALTARNALDGVIGLDPARTSFAGGTLKFYSKRGQRVNTLQVRTKLSAAGFGFVSVRTTGIE